MNDAVVEFGEFRAVPSVSSPDEIAGDALEFIYVVAAAFRAGVERIGRILVSAVHAAVAVMVDRAVTDVVSVHESYDVGNSLGIVGSVAVDLNIENMSAACEFMIWSLDFGFMLRRTVVVDRHMIRVGVVDLICYAGYNAKRFTVLDGEFA